MGFFTSLRCVQNDPRQLLDDRVVVVERNNLKPGIANLQRHGIPGVIVHGRYDVVCPLEQAWLLHQAWPQANLEIIPDAGHSATEPGIVDALLRATGRFARLLR